MPTAANPQSAQNPGWQNAGWQNAGPQNPGWGSPWGNQAAGGQAFGSQAAGGQAFGSQAAGGQAFGGQASGNPGWPHPYFWHHDGMSRPLGIAATILGFIVWWPVGLALLFYTIFSGRFGCGRRRWAQGPNGQGPQGGNGWQSCIPPWANWCSNGGRGGNSNKQSSSGNHAFDEYRAETLRRLEEEQNEFSSFLDRLRFAKDKSEFDQFMAERRQTPRPPVVPDEPSHD
jgi:Protein of unknown function (DUF2852)